MPTLSTAASKNAKVTGVVSFTGTEERFVIFAKIISVIKAAWPKKTAANVAFLTGVSERAVQFWLAGETRMTLEHVAALLRTNEGYLILEAIMGDCKEEWWITTKNAQRLRLNRRQIAAAQKRLDDIKAEQAQIDFFQQ
jgi:hypothetical protein